MTFKTKLNEDGTVQITHTPKGYTELVYTVKKSFVDPDTVYVLNGTEGDTTPVVLGNLVTELERRSEKALALHSSVYKTLNTEPTEEPKSNIDINLPEGFDLNKIPELLFKALRERGVTL